MTPLFAGIDVGSVSVKVVLLDGAGKVLARSTRVGGIDMAGAAKTGLAAALEEIGAALEDITAQVATGYGRDLCAAGRKVTEISCHAKAGHHFHAGNCTILDIGGQDTKIIKVNEKGAVGDFRMNRNCAAGTGAFLEEIARRLGLELGEMNRLAAGTKETATLSSFCTVFAMTEVLKRIREGATPAALARGVYESMVSRTLELAPLTGDVVATGGVVEHHPVFTELLALRSGVAIRVLPHAQHAGAWGAAIMARGR